MFLNRWIAIACVGFFVAPAFAQDATPPVPVSPAVTAQPVQNAAQETAVIQTSLGTITIALDRAHAPASVDNFLRYTREAHFDGTVIYRVEPGFVLQMGSFDAKGAERPVHEPIALESGNGLSNSRGSVAMARSDEPVSATAEFFIDLADNKRLDAHAGAPAGTTGYAVFGKVVSGMDVVDKIAATPLGGQGGPFPPTSTPITPVTVEKITVGTDTPAK